MRRCGYWVPHWHIVQHAAWGDCLEVCCARQDVAERVGREAVARHYRPRVAAMDEYDIAQLPTERLIIFVASTAGQARCCVTANCEQVAVCRKASL